MRQIQLLAITLALAGCSSPQLYGAGQAWQRNECTKIQDMEQRQRCFKSTAMSHDEYLRQQEAAKAAR